MILAYAVIIAGGLLITRRLRLLALAADLLGGLDGRHRRPRRLGSLHDRELGVRAGLRRRLLAGHRHLARGADLPVLHDHGPEDGAGRVGSAASCSASLVALASTLLMAPQTNEFGTKVGLLAGLVVVCAARPLLDRLLPEPRSAADGLAPVRDPTGDRRRRGRGGRPGRPAGRAHRGRGPGRRGRDRRRRDPGARAGRPRHGRDARRRARTRSIRPRSRTITVDVPAWDGTTIAAPIAQGILVTLGEDLELENQALLRADASILTAVDHGDRLEEMQGRLRDAAASGRTRHRALPIRLRAT